MITRKQFKLLKFIDKSMKAEGYPPSYEEMREAMDIKSKSGIHRLIKSLEERGFLRRMENKARAIEIIKIPGYQSTKTQPAPKPSVSASVQWPSDEAIGDTIIPLMGRIAAGSPIEAISTRESDIGIPQHLISGIGEHYALKVVGDSMVGAGILDDDTVIIRRQATASNGEIIVALIRGEEATLKRLRCRGTSIALEAANPDYETRMYRADEVAVQGRLVGLLRSY